MTSNWKSAGGYFTSIYILGRIIIVLCTTLVKLCLVQKEYIQMNWTTSRDSTQFNLKGKYVSRKYDVISKMFV